ncbi:MAG: hypothetical protein IJV03_02040 [Alphaproteobacteria bacterium]|nr:hypothetical protein [Alphaproteobacteria bacterium]
MWKYIFEIGDLLSSLIPVKKWRDYMRIQILFDYRRKFNALKSKYKNIHFHNMRLTKGGGSIVFVIDNKTTFKVRKYNFEANDFERFNREKMITDALNPLRKQTKIDFPKIEFIETGGYTFYKTNFIQGKLLVNIPSHKIIKNLDKISTQLADFIYKKSLLDPIELKQIRGKKQAGFCWVHSDMCSNILINPKTMNITGIIDWEWCRYDSIEREFWGLVRVRKKMRKIGLDKTTKLAYEKILSKNK